jgi:hypothetical protein
VTRFEAGLDRFWPLFAWFVFLEIVSDLAASLPLDPIPDSPLRHLWAQVVMPLEIPAVALVLIVLLMRWFLVETVCVIERLDVFRSIKRSEMLTKGHRWRILGISILFCAGPAALSLYPMGLDAAVGDGVAPVVLFIAYSFVGASYSAVAVAYYHLRTSSAEARIFV